MDAPYCSLYLSFFSSLLAHLVIYPDPGVEVALLRGVLVRRRFQRRREEHFEALRAPSAAEEVKGKGHSAHFNTLLGSFCGLN